MARGILLVGHGTRDPEGNAQFMALASALAGRRSELALEPCFLDHAEPGVQAGIDRLAARGVDRVGIVPLFLFAAGHAKRDMPAHLATARQRYPGISFGMSDVLGVQPALVAACAAALSAAEAEVPVMNRPQAQAPGVNRAETAVLLVGRGSSDPDANADLHKVARLIWEETGYGFVECAYSDVTRPRVDDGLARCIRLGARRVILLPYFLFRGVLMERLKTLLATWQAQEPGTEFAFAGAEGLGGWPALQELILERADDALAQ
ncbi:MAG: sirohydrochlorin cobaltochelatase [Firmicutes bacterium]|nr:sirohydrochlorin cobaltochelatase [Bacillota bacterium]